MYAIIETGGKQYKVSEGDIITVEKLAVEALSLIQMPDAVSKGLNLWHKFSLIGRKPILVGTLLLVFLAIKPRRIVSWLLSATVLFKTWRRFGPFIMPVISYLARRIK